MEFNNCSRCGCFHTQSGNVCPNCIIKDSIEIKKLENYLENYSVPNTIEQLSKNTSISIKNLNRIINENSQFSKLNIF